MNAVGAVFGCLEVFLVLKKTHRFCFVVSLFLVLVLVVFIFCINTRRKAGGGEGLDTDMLEL